MNGVFRLSEGASLALHGMGLLALLGERTSVSRMAELLCVSQTHLAKVFQKLVRAELVRSIRGVAGGFELARAPEEITLLQVFQAVSGCETDQRECILGLEKCPFNGCLFGDFPMRMNKAFMKQMGDHTLRDFIDTGEKSE